MPTAEGQGLTTQGLTTQVLTTQVLATLATCAPRTRRHIWADAESLASAAVLAAVLFVGLLTIRDQGITVDEFVFDEFGPKMLDWYLSGFHKTYSYFDEGVVYYGPWFQILV